MPYIMPGHRDDFDGMIRALLDFIENVGGLKAGELNYIVTRICLSNLQARKGEASYEDYNRLVGVLEAVKLELYRRRVVPFEDGKIAQNGDVL